MSESNLSPAPEAPMNADDVIEYLRNNPKFLQQNPEAMDLLVPPKTEAGKGIADFQNYMIQRLKADKEQVMTTSREIVETSRANMNNQQRIHKAVLRLLEANSFEDFIQSITMDLASILDVDIAVFIVESNGGEIPHIHTSGIRVIPTGTVDKWMAGKNVLLQENISGIEPIYGGGAALVKSQILLRVDISMDTPPAILAFGSRDAGMFQEGQATDQILFLARVIERCFRAWLNLPI
ncbi:MAG: DUF484 family protein [Alphaproteobacteria bacterium PRO2]|nr:DUF484 family protein [Alphaproteobacteria bacterium PRO2]